MSRNNSLEMDQLTDAAYYILLSLLVPRHGYGIMNYIEKLTQGEVVIGPATAYTLIKKLQDNECILLAGEDNNDRRKTYAITDKGKQLVSNEIERRKRMSEHGNQAWLSAKEEHDNG
ncbi:PadR family transcriptional regulator [Cohnella herbarum]|uniref:PadR family transcriptional regulator n=1 Tax=Cohnella herbarum TaxID=2728023 RepID=A0A7Z2VN65_9BACL|nr:PadR family transcriptional regulator [Cohnella herbarum]